MKALMKKAKILILFIFSIILNSSYAQFPVTVTKAYQHVKEQFDQYHVVSYVYSDDNAGGNIFIPSIIQGDVNNISINQAYTINPYSGRSCTQIIFPFLNAISFDAIKYVYPEYNIGLRKGFNLAGVSKLYYQVHGNGNIELQMGGMNRRPFHNPNLPVQDGMDIRSSGLISLGPGWHYDSINLVDSTLWVYKDSTGGISNRYPQPMYMGPNNNFYFNFYYGASNGPGDYCMKIYWYGGNQWGGVFLFPPEATWDTAQQGYDLTGIDTIYFKAKISTPGKVKFLIGTQHDSCGENTKIFTLTQQWTWYKWALNTSLNFSNVVGGFGFTVSSDSSIGTPNNSTTYVDSVYYKGVYLKSDFSNVICGLSVSANKNQNPVPAEIFIDDVYYDKNRTNDPRFCQSFVSLIDSIDIAQKNNANTNDNALEAITNLLLYKSTLDSQYLNDAELIGDAFIYALDHDRFFTDNRTRNGYKCGELARFDTVNLPGWWDETVKIWNEDNVTLSTYTGNVAWAGIALLSLFEATNNSKYINAAETIAGWCINKTETNSGFTGGFLGRDANQQKLTWKSTEHNLNLYALFARLYCLTFDSQYYDAALNAKHFVFKMWKNYDNFFWAGTKNDGDTINQDYAKIPANIQALYILSLLDSTSIYSSGLSWAKEYCYMQNFTSPNYSKSLNGFDYNMDEDGIWFDVSATVALGYKLTGNHSFADSVISEIEYVQNHGPMNINNNKGIVSADHNNVSSGSDWSANNRLSINATCWYILAKLGFNPYYYSCIPYPPLSIMEKINPIKDHIRLFQNYPNPCASFTDISFSVNQKQRIKLEIYNIQGQLIKTLLDKEVSTGLNHISWNSENSFGAKVQPGVYYYRLSSSNSNLTNKMLVY